MNNSQSLTAEYLAFFRALESSRYAHSRLFFDPFSSLFLRQRRKLVYQLSRIELGRWLVERTLDRKVPGARATGIARTKWIDEQTLRALETAEQLVLLGAGFDTRAYRLSATEQATVFEVDCPETLYSKQTILKEYFGSMPKRIRFVEIDLNRDALTEVLSQAGFDWTRPACFIWEGVTNYLTAQAVDDILRQIGQAATGSTLLFSYIHRSLFDRPKQFFGGEKLLSRLESLGEPWTFGLDPAEVEAYLAERGLRLVKDVSIEEVWKRTGRRHHGIRGSEFYRLASAHIELDTPLPQARRQP